MIDIELGRIVIHEQSLDGPQYIYLREVKGERSFPIIIGHTEATEIKRVVTGMKTERPMTHELLANTITLMGGTLAAVEIVDMRRQTFYASLRIQGPDGEAIGSLDARPSDSIALAMRTGCPLRVSELILDAVRTDEGKDEIDGGEPKDPPTDPETPPPGLPDF